MKFNDLTGKRFGHWVVISRAENKGHHTMWNCKCDCGTKKAVYASHLTSGLSPSCGCITRGAIGGLNRSHGMSKTRIYEIWCGIKKRCENPNSSGFHIYGSREIKICDLWRHDFLKFYDWAIKNGYSDSLTIDRIDVNGDYCPENCRWVDAKTQSNNTRRTIIVNYNGESLSVKQLSEKIGANYNRLLKAIRKYNMNVDDAIAYAKSGERHRPKKE